MECFTFLGKLYLSFFPDRLNDLGGLEIRSWFVLEIHNDQKIWLTEIFKQFWATVMPKLQSDGYKRGYFHKI